MRFEGTVKSWNEERGFGFIAPSQGGQEIFFHIKAFPPRAGRPQLNQAVTFELILNHDGKKRARDVQLAAVARVARKPRRAERPAAWSTASLLAIPAFVAVYLAVALAWRVPHWVAALYLGASLACFMAYAFDKSAAMAGRWRTAERTLIAIGLVGGWPGAIVAQQILRHKSNKASFRDMFWLSVAVNVLAFVALNSPWAPALRR